MLARGADGKPDTFAAEAAELSAVRHWAAGDLAAGPSSGSYPVKGMLIVPASTACVAGVALGLSKDLLQRAASVTLKEGRRLVVAVRETPLNGQTLPVPHGAPLRLRVERQLGYKQAKFVMRVEAVDSFARFGKGRGGFWPDRGYEWYAGI